MWNNWQLQLKNHIRKKNKTYNFYSIRLQHVTLNDFHFHNLGYAGEPWLVGYHWWGDVGWSRITESGYSNGKQHMEINRSDIAFTCVKDALKKQNNNKSAKQKNVDLVVVREKRPALDCYSPLEQRSAAIINTSFQVAFSLARKQTESPDFGHFQKFISCSLWCFASSSTVYPYI